MATTTNASTKVITGKVRLSYVSVFETNDKGKYSTAILITKSDKATLDKIKAALEADRTLGGACSTLQVASTRPREVVVSGVNMIAYRFEVRIYG